MNNMTRKIMQSLLLKITHFDQASSVRLATRLQLAVVRRLPSCEACFVQGT